MKTFHGAIFPKPKKHCTDRLTGAAAPRAKAIFPQLQSSIDFHIPDHRTAKEHLLKIIVVVEAGCYLVS